MAVLPPMVLIYTGIGAFANHPMQRKYGYVRSGTEWYGILRIRHRTDELWRTGGGASKRLLMGALACCGEKSPFHSVNIRKIP